MKLVAIHAGELIALSVASLWGLASIIWTKVGETIPAVEMNLIKAVLASGLMLAAILIGGIGLAGVPVEGMLLLAASGAVGIAIGDTALFAAFQRIGPTRTQLIKLLSPPLVSLVALASLQEQLSPGMLGGVVVTVLGIFLVMSERMPHDPVSRHSFWEGVGLGLLSSLAEVVGVVLSRGVLARTSIDPAWSALLRLASAGVLAWLWMALTHQKIGGWLPKILLTEGTDDPPAQSRSHLNSRQRLALLITAGVVCGTFVGLWLQQIALKITAAGVAQTLFATSPLFILLILAVVERKPPSLRALLGILVAIGGVALLFVG